MFREHIRQDLQDEQDQNTNLVNPVHNELMMLQPALHACPSPQVPSQKAP